jgi:hypothetical protein
VHRNSSAKLCVRCAVTAAQSCVCDVLITHRNIRTHTHSLLLTSRNLPFLLNPFSGRTADSYTSSQATMHYPWNTTALSVSTPHCTVPQARLIQFVPFKQSHSFRISRHNFVPDNYHLCAFFHLPRHQYSTAYQVTHACQNVTVDSTLVIIGTICCNVPYDSNKQH